MTLDLYVDVACVHSYMGFRQLRRALTDTRSTQDDVILHIRPLLVAPDAPIGDYEPIQDVHRRDLGAAWRSMEESMAQRGASAGAPMNFSDVKFTSTIPAHVAVQQLQEKDPRSSEELLDHLFHAYFVGGAMISDIDWLAEFCLRHEYSAPTFVPPAVEQVRKQAKNARLRGVTSAPTLVFPDGYRVTGARSQEQYASALRVHTER